MKKQNEKKAERIKNEKKLNGKKPAFMRRTLISRVDVLNRFKHWWVGGKSLTRSLFRVVAAWQGIAVIGTVLGIAYIMAAFYTQAGEFVIRIDNPADASLKLCDTPDFEEPLVLLKGKSIPQADNISIFDLDPDLVFANGNNNGADYVAYTFYLKNVSMLETNYQYNLSIRSSSKGAEEAAWVLFYHNGEQKMYAKENKEGRPECQFSEYEFPFTEDAKNKEVQLQQLSSSNRGYLTQEVINAHDFTSIDSVYQLQTEPFATSKIICTDTREALQPGEIDKFTVVIWLEGEDPECIDDILGGHVELIMKFTY